MSNHPFFQNDYLQKLIEPFAPGMTRHITPIKYEALTPDSFLFLFRTTGQDGQNHFFVSLEFDHIDGFDGARCTVEDWYGSFMRFLPLATTIEVQEDDIATFQATTDGPYYAMLAEVPQPTFKGYWSDAVTIMPGDVIAAKIGHYPDKDQATIRKSLAHILRHKIDPEASFIESYTRTTKDTIVNDTNMTDLAVSIYVQPDGAIEYFTNYLSRPALKQNDSEA